MTGDAQRRRELGKFLRVRRQQLVRAELGLPTIGRRNTGLRREEVSYLSGVSLTWYTWLEQGREITPSRQVLDAIARTLCLSCSQHAYVLALSGYSAPAPTPEPASPAVPERTQRLLDAVVDLPAYLLAPTWAILAWTPAFAAIYPRVATVPEEDRNMLWLVFTDPYQREVQVDWELHCARHLARFRADAGPRLGEPPFARLVERLLGASELFRARWEDHDVENFISSNHIFRHPDVGALYLEHHRMTLSEHPNLDLAVYTPVPDTDTSARLRRLVGSGAALGAC
ncbi:MAG: helix-turn-helix domain-containing protein [Pseudonocardia sp.]|nr:helix-turn-helix domain-containing protein [Pseudonocardia sp.]